MTKNQARELFEAICQQGRNRMIDWGVPNASFHVVDCQHSDGLHIEIRKDTKPVGELHIWNPGVPDVPPSIYEQFIFSICKGILAAEDFLRYIEEVKRDAELKFGKPPSHGGRLN